MLFILMYGDFQMNLIPDEVESQRLLRSWSRLYHKRQRRAKKLPRGFQLVQNVNIFDKQDPTVLMHEDNDYRPHRPRKTK